MVQADGADRWVLVVSVQAAVAGKWELEVLEDQAGKWVLVVQAVLEDEADRLVLVVQVGLADVAGMLAPEGWVEWVDGADRLVLVVGLAARTVVVHRMEPEQ